MGFLKLDEGILTSTLWFDRIGRDIFLVAGLKARPRMFSDPVPVFAPSSLGGAIYTLPPGEYGFTECSGPGLVAAAGHIHADPADWEIGMSGLRRLTEPDPESRSSEYGGRRLARVQGGYIVLNLMRYRDRDSTATERKRRQREREFQTEPGKSRCHGDVTRDTQENGPRNRDVTQDRRQKTEVRKQEGSSLLPGTGLPALPPATTNQEPTNCNDGQDGIPPADRTERSIRQRTDALRSKLYGLVDAMVAKDPRKRDPTELMRLVTGYRRGDGRDVGGVVNAGLLTFERLEKSIEDAEANLQDWGEK